MIEIPITRLGILGILGVLGIWTNEPALFALFALFTLFASDRTVTIPPTATAGEDDSRQ